MHRSGTSLVARIVNLLGIDLGPPALLLPPRPDNPRGFWEHAPFTALNDAVLAALGGTWDDPPPLPAGWYRAAELRSLRDRARRLVDEPLRDAIRRCRRGSGSGGHGS